MKFEPKCLYSDYYKNKGIVLVLMQLFQPNAGVYVTSRFITFLKSLA